VAGARLLLLSHGSDTPASVAEQLSTCGWGPSRMTVFEHLGGERQAVFSGTAATWGERGAADLNTIALECVPGPGARPLSRVAGLPDDAFEHDGQLTKREVRAVTLARLSPLPGEMLWDVGAGCGSIAIEWLRAVPGASAVVVEHNEARVAMIARNAARLGVPGLRIVAARAPGALAGLNPPDAVFIGGGIDGPGLLETAWAALRPGGRLVANVVSLEGERRVLDWRARNGGELTRIAISRAEGLGAHHGWRPQMPVTQLFAGKSV
jgi:precorrin-6Y C5,15-methyltransferase (decarboxylating)